MGIGYDRRSLGRRAGSDISGFVRFVRFVLASAIGMEFAVSLAHGATLRRATEIGRSEGRDLAMRCAKMVMHTLPGDQHPARSISIE